MLNGDKAHTGLHMLAMANININLIKSEICLKISNVLGNILRVPVHVHVDSC